MMVLIVAGIVHLPEQLKAHEIPNDIIVQAYLKADGAVANLAIRVPLEAMRDMNFPVHGPGYLELDQISELTLDAAEIWLANFIDVYEGQRKIEDWRIADTRISLPSDRSFGDYQTALHSFSLPDLAKDSLLHYEQALLDVLIEYPIQSNGQNFSIDLNLGGLSLNTATVLTYVTPDGTTRLYEFRGSPGLVELDPTWYESFLRFVISGFDHILGGLDHLLFIFCLVLPCRQLRPLIITITAFTCAHSITLMAAAFGMVPKVLWFPPLIEMLIALSIVYMALENILRNNFQERWPIAFAFGLIHGFGFSFALSETLQFAGQHLITSLLGFNLGVEIGQVFMIIIAVPILNYLFHLVISEKLGILVLSILLAHTAWHWMLDRYEILSAYQVTNFSLGAMTAEEYLSWFGLVIIISLMLLTLKKGFKVFQNKG